MSKKFFFEYIGIGQYFKGKETRRARWFIHILCLLPRANFHPIALLRHAKKQIDNLEKHPIYMGDNLSIEIVPFGDLLEILLKQLAVRAA